MSTHKYHRIQVRNRPGSEDKLTSGATTEVLLDGKRLGGARFFKFEVSSSKVCKVLIELYAIVEIDANVELGEPKVEETLLQTDKKAIEIHTLSNYGPTIIAEEK